MRSWFVSPISRSPASRSTSSRLGSGPRFQILSHIFARCSSQTTHGHARIARKRVRFPFPKVPAPAAAWTHFLCVPALVINTGAVHPPLHPFLRFHTCRCCPACSSPLAPLPLEVGRGLTHSRFWVRCTIFCLLDIGKWA